MTFQFVIFSKTSKSCDTKASIEINFPDASITMFGNETTCGASQVVMKSLPSIQEQFQFVAASHNADWILFVPENVVLVKASKLDVLLSTDSVMWEETIGEDKIVAVKRDWIVKRKLPELVSLIEKKQTAIEVKVIETTNDGAFVTPENAIQAKQAMITSKANAISRLAAMSVASQKAQVSIVKTQVLNQDVATRELQEKRLRICTNCPSKFVKLDKDGKPFSCGNLITAAGTGEGCGCLIHSKVVDITSSCPQRHW